MTEEKKKKRRNKYLKFVTAIQNNALTTKLPNCASTELTYQQALSVLLRSRQLAREGALHPNRIDPEEMAKQVDICYKQRERDKRRANKPLTKERESV